MKPCACSGPHDRRRIVLTGGPGAGKTAVLELLRIEVPECCRAQVVPALVEGTRRA